MVDNTNATAAARARYITAAKAAGFSVIGYYFSSDVQAALDRNRQRAGREQIPEKAILGLARLLERPSPAEGFDQLWYVRMDDSGGFIVEEWHE